jgi:DNA-binding MarR family transcriptional regulator
LKKPVQRALSDPVSPTPSPGQAVETLEPSAVSTAAVDEAVRSLRMLILAGENYRQTAAQALGLGITEAQALSYLAVHGERGQNELATDLGITSSAATALVDRLERQGVAERYAHPSDRRRTQVRLSAGGRAHIQRTHDWLAAALGNVQPAELSALTQALHRVADELRAVSSRVSAEQR